MTLVIGPKCKIKLHFALRLADTGEVVDSTFERNPAVLIMGDGNLPAPFETTLVGLQAGDRRVTRIAPKDGFGQHNPSNVQTISRDQFDPQLDLSEGLVVSFQDAAKTELPGVVVEFDTSSVRVDFNHPLAGRDLDFEVEILDVSPGELH